MKELVIIPVTLAMGMAFLVGFSTKGTPYIAERRAYYQTLESSALDEKTRAVYRMAASDVFLGPAQKGRNGPSLRLCLAGPYPRMTTLPWLGSSMEENRQWHIRNERACLDELKTEFLANGNEVGRQALDKIQPPDS